MSNPSNTALKIKAAAAPLQRAVAPFKLGHLRKTIPEIFMKQLQWMRPLNCYFIMSICMLFIMTSAAGAKQKNTDQVPGRTMARQATKVKEIWSTVDHSTHQALQKEFKSGADITKACLSCHSEADAQFRKTIHWTWFGTSADSEKRFGKAGDSLNNFCISTNNMQDKSCAACHPGWNGKEDR